MMTALGPVVGRAQQSNLVSVRSCSILSAWHGVASRTMVEKGEMDKIRMSSELLMYLRTNSLTVRVPRIDFPLSSLFRRDYEIASSGSPLGISSPLWIKRISAEPLTMQCPAFIPTQSPNVTSTCTEYRAYYNLSSCVPYHQPVAVHRGFSPHPKIPPLFDPPPSHQA